MPNDKPRCAGLDRGYTLIEILVVLTIIGILFSVGYVGYRDFSRRQSLAGAAKIVQGDLRKAQQNALSGIKPQSAACLGANTLDGYFFRVTSASTYEIGAACSGGNVVTDTVSVTESISISTPSPNPIIFKVLGTGTNIPSGDASVTLTQGATNDTLTILIGSGGDVR